MRGLMGFVVWSLVEIALFVTVGSWIGVLGTLMVVLGTGMLGVALLRRQGVQMGRAVRDPGALMAHSGLIALAAVALILPGFLTDALGLVLLVPMVRQVIIDRLGARLKAAGVVRTAAPGDVIDVVAVEVEHDAVREPSGWTKP